MDKGVLLYIHLNLSFSLLLAFLVFVAGLETATSIPVRAKRTIYISNCYILLYVGPVHYNLCSDPILLHVCFFLDVG